MAGGEIGYYTLPVIVSFKGIDAQVEDKLGKSIKDLGKKTGEELGTAVIAGLDPTKSPKVDAAIKGSSGAGKKMGDAITTEVAKNIDGKKIGTQVTKDIQTVDVKPVGKKMGKDISEGLGTELRSGTPIKDVLKGGLNEATAVAKEWGNQVGKEILAGDIKGAAKDVDTVIKNTTGSINNLGKLVGVNLDSVEQFGTTAVTKIDSLASTAQGVVDRITGTVTDVKGARDAIKSLTSGDTISRLQGVSSAMTAIDTATAHFGVNVSGITAPIASVATTAAGVADTATTLKGLVAPGAATAATFIEGGGLGSGIAEAVTALGGLGSAATLAAGPLLAIGGMAAAGKWFHDLANWDPNQNALDPNATIPTVPFQQGLPPLIKPARPTPRGDFVPAPPPKPPAPGRVAATEIPQPGWTRDPKTGTLYTPDGVAVEATPGEYAHPAPAPSGWGSTGARITAPEIAPASTSGGGWGAGGKGTKLGDFGGAVGSANVTATSATISVGSATISGVSLPAASPGVTAGVSRPGFKSWYQTGGGITGPGGVDQVPILATAGEHMLTVDDVNALGGQAGVYDFRRSLHGLNGGGPPPPPPRWQPRRPIIPNRAAIKGVYHGGAILGYDDGGEIRDAVGAIAPAVAAAAAEGAAKGAAAGGGGGGGSPLQAFSGGAGGQQDSLQFLTNMLGVGASGAGEELGLGTVFPDPMANPNVKSIMGLFSALSGPIKGAMAGKLGIQQPGWRPGMPVAAMANNQQSAGSIGLPFGLPSIDIPAAPAPGPPEAPGGAPGGGPGGSTFNVDASINYHDGSVLGVDPAAQRATDTRTQERNLANTVAPVDPGNH